MTNSTILELKKIGKIFKQGGEELKVLDNIDLTLQKSQIMSIVGESGSGKSTLLHIAGLLESASSGHVFIDSVDSCGLDHAKIRNEKIGFVYQQHHLLNDFSALENVAMPQIIKGIQIKEALENARYILGQVGLADRVDYFPGQLSGGQMQRVAIARALINKPKLILADEPTGNLDPRAASQIFDLFIDQAKNLKTSVLIVTHNMELAMKSELVYQLTTSLQRIN